MHELSVAQSLIELIESQLADDRAGVDRARVVAVRVHVGALSGVVPAALRSAFGPAAEGTIASGARLELEAVPVTVWCPNCAAERVLPAAIRLCCPVCETRTPRVLRGRELELVSLEVVDEATQGSVYGSAPLAASQIDRASASGTFAGAQPICDAASGENEAARPADVG